MYYLASVYLRHALRTACTAYGKHYGRHALRTACAAYGMHCVRHALCDALGALIDAAGQIATAAASTMGGLVPARLIVGVGSATGGSTGAAASAYQMDVLAKSPEHSGRLLGLIQALQSALQRASQRALQSALQSALHRALHRAFTWCIT